MKKLKLLKDWKISFKKGTEFESIDGRTTEFCDGNYAKLLGLTNDSTAEVIIGFDYLDDNIKDLFKEIGM